MAEPAFSDSTENDSIEPRYDPAKVTSANFDTVRRGFNEAQVRKFLGDLAVGLRNAYRTEDELRERIEELVNRLAEADGVDEVTLIERLGEQAASLLKSARSSAKTRTDEADEHAEQVVSEAEAQADTVRIAAEEQAASTIGGATDEATAMLAEANEASTSMRDEAASVLELRTTEAEVEAEKRVHAAENEVAAARMRADQIIAEAKQEGRVMIVEVQRHREQLLENIERRRRRTQVHVERLQAGRDRLVEAYDVVQLGVDSARAELNVSGSSAKIAGDRAARQFEGSNSRTVHELEEDLFVAKAAGLLGDPEGIIAEAAAQAAQPAVTATAPVEPDTSVDESTQAVVTEPVAEPAIEPEITAESADESEPIPSIETVVEPEAPKPSLQLVEDLETETTPPADSLFARLRAERTAAAAEAQEVLDDLTTDVPDAKAADTPDSEPAAPSEDPPEYLSRLDERDDRLAPMTSAAARSIKRALADAQNEVLDALRTGDEEALTQPLDGMRQSMRIALAESWAEGANFVGRSGDPTDAAVDPILDVMAIQTLEPLRAQFAESINSGHPVEAVRAHGRSLRSQLNSLASSAAVAAFQAGIIDTLPAGCPVRWVAEPACEHGVQNGAVDGRLGDPFPSGVAKPEPMGECQCLVIPLHQ